MDKNKKRSTLIRRKGKEYRCPIEIALDMIGGKWKSLILWHLNEKDHRFGDLQKIIPGVSKKMLSQQLRELEGDGLIERRAYPEVPPRVEYYITEKGESLFPILKTLENWFEENINDFEIIRV